jgi:hypothetical protein
VYFNVTELVQQKKIPYMYSVVSLSNTRQEIGENFCISLPKWKSFEIKSILCFLCIALNCFWFDLLIFSKTETKDRNSKSRQPSRALALMSFCQKMFACRASARVSMRHLENKRIMSWNLCLMLKHMRNLVKFAILGILV